VVAKKTKTADARQTLRQSGYGLSAIDLTLSDQRCRESVDRLFDEPIGEGCPMPLGFLAPIHRRMDECDCKAHIPEKDFICWYSHYDPEYPDDEDWICLESSHAVVEETAHNLEVFLDQTVFLGGVPDDDDASLQYHVLIWLINRFFFTLATTALGQNHLWR
jgi:hypothetical protein